MKKVLSLFVAFLVLVSSVNLVVEGAVVETIVNDSTIGAGMNQFQYFGGWSTSPNNNVFEGGDEHWTAGGDNTSKYFTLTFYGSGVKLYASKNTKHGLATVSVDGKAYPDADFSTSGATAHKQLIFKIEGLTEGEHKLTVRGKNIAGSGTGKELQVDYAVVLHEPYVAKSIEAEPIISAMIGKTAQLKYTASPKFVELTDETFTVADTSIATVSPTGLITGVAIGETTVTIASAMYNINKIVRVKILPLPTIANAIIGDTNVQYLQNLFTEIRDTVATSKKLAAWKGDVVNTEVVIAAITNLTNVTVTSDDFVSGVNTFAKSNIDIKFIREVKGKLGYGLGNPATNPSFPDIIDTAAARNVSQGKIQAAWIQINTPRDAVPGIYTGKVYVNATELTTPIALDYSLEIIDILMPTPKEYDMKMEMWQFPDSAAAYYGVTPWGPEHVKVLQSQAILSKEMGANEITVPLIDEPWRLGITDNKDQTFTPSYGMVRMIKNTTTGALTFDFSIMDKWIRLNEAVMDIDKIVPFGMLPWNPTIYTFRENTADGNKVTEEIAHGSPRWIEVWTKFLDVFIPHMEANGWFDKVYMAADERPVAALTAMMDLLDSKPGTNGKTLKRALSLNHLDGAAAANADTVFVGYDLTKRNAAGFKNYREARDANTTKKCVSGIYFCTGMRPNNFTYSLPCESYFSTMYSGAKGATGFERWAFDAFVADPLNDTSHRVFEAGDCFLIYPDEKANVANPVAKYSVRLRKLYEGLSDANKIRYMEKNAPSMKDDIAKVWVSIDKSYGFGANAVANDETRITFPKDMTELRENVMEVSRQFAARGEETVIPGDSDKSGVVDIKDALIALKLAVGIELDPATYSLKAANISGTGTVSKEDARQILDKATTTN